MGLPTPEEYEGACCVPAQTPTPELALGPSAVDVARDGCRDVRLTRDGYRRY